MKNKLKIKSFDLYGLREEKYKYLETHDVKNTKWQVLDLKEPSCFFVPKDTAGEGTYSKFISFGDIFNIFSTGVKTHRDDFVLDYSKEALKRKLAIFSDSKFGDQFIKATFNLKESKSWLLSSNRSFFIKKGIDDNLFKQYAYRPFDNRWIYYDKNLITRSRADEIWQISIKNPALITTKILSLDSFSHIFISQFVPDICLISLQTKESSYIFPLYLYKSEKQESVFNGQKTLDLAKTQKQLDEFSKDKIPNIKKEIIDWLNASYKKRISPEEIFYYIYAVLYTNKYRQKYNEFLKIDFPRVPFTDDYKLFKKLSAIGEELAELHLLKSKKIGKLTAKFPKIGDNKVEKREYNEKQKRIYISEEQYFENIDKEVWEYYIGGYQVLDKWLKDRMGERLSKENVDHYLEVITALKLTIESQKEIDILYPQVEKNLLKIG